MNTPIDIYIDIKSCKYTEKTYRDNRRLHESLSVANKVI